MQYKVVDQQVFAEQGPEADGFKELTTDTIYISGDVLLGLSESPYMVVQRIGDTMTDIILLIVAPVQFGKVSNLTNMQGQRIVT